MYIYICMCVCVCVCECMSLYMYVCVCTWTTESPVYLSLLVFVSRLYNIIHILVPWPGCVKKLGSDHDAEKLSSDHGVEKLGCDSDVEKLGSDNGVVKLGFRPLRHTVKFFGCLPREIFITPRGMPNIGSGVSIVWYERLLRIVSFSLCRWTEVRS